MPDYERGHIAENDMHLFIGSTHDEYSLQKRSKIKRKGAPRYSTVTVWGAPLFFAEGQGKGGSGGEGRHHSAEERDLGPKPWGRSWARGRERNWPSPLATRTSSWGQNS